MRLRLTPFRSFVLSLACMTILVSRAADRRLASAQPPAGLSAAAVPQFILLGFDDNPDAGPLRWFIDYLAPLRNPAGAGQTATYDGGAVRAIFYSNGRYWTDAATVAAHRDAFAAGHEIGNHTHNHEHGKEFSVAKWRQEMATCRETFVAAGISAQAMIGYRTPFLEYNAATFAAAAAEGFVYDSSIEEGEQKDQDGTNFFWPYTLDDGSPGNAAEHPAGSARRVASHPGLWEIPIHVFLVPSDEECARYDVKPGLRARIRANIQQAWGWDWSAEDGKISGLDWNVLEMAKLDGPEFLAIMKYTLDRRLAGNRAPFMVGGHTALYPADKPDRRQAMEEFIAYALTKPEVRFVTGHQLLAWLRQPVALKE